MARKPLKSKEEIAAVPLDQSVDLDVSDDPYVEVVDDKPEKKKLNGAELRAAPEPPPQDDGSADLRKQLDDLKRAEETARNRANDAERQLHDANRQHENRLVQSDYENVTSSLQAAKTEMDAAKQAKKSAMEVGNFDAAIEADERMALAASDIRDLERGKEELEYKREYLKTAPKQESPPAQQDPFENAISQLPDTAKNWLRGHREYMTDQRKNLKIQSAHLEVTDSGVTAYSPEYFVSLETKLGLREAPKTDDDDPEDPPPTRRTPVSAPVSREVASPSTGRPSPQKVTLTAEEREMARLSMPNTDPGEAERIYAQQKLKLQQLKREGHYQER